jgi:iron complex transport system ATP-binding protein
VSLQIQAGECVAVVGPNGAGKTTLLLALLGLLPVASGRVRLRGLPLRAWRGRREIAREMAYVPQSYEGFPGFTVEDLVATGRHAHRGPLSPPGTRDRAAIELALERCGLIHLRTRIASQLSCGERQKVHIAAAIAQESPILLLDEPTASLDVHHQIAVLGMLRSLLSQGQTLVIVCHDLNVASALGARALALRAGRVAFDGAVDALLNAGRLREIFEADFTVIDHAGRPGVLPRL